MSKGRRLWSLHSLSPPPPLVDTPLRLKTYWRIRKLLQVKNALTGKEELGKEIYNRRRNVHLIAGEKPCWESLSCSHCTSPFVGLGLLILKSKRILYFISRPALGSPECFTCMLRHKASWSASSRMRVTLKACHNPSPFALTSEGELNHEGVGHQGVLGVDIVPQGNL